MFTVILIGLSRSRNPSLPRGLRNEQRLPHCGYIALCFTGFGITVRSALKIASNFKMLNRLFYDNFEALIDFVLVKYMF